MLLALVGASVAAPPPTCQDQGGSAVDWWIMWKAPSCVIPPIPGHSEPLYLCKAGNMSVDNYTIGYHYLYADARQPSLVLVHNNTLRCTKSECDTSSPFSRTMAQLFSAHISSLAYNDQPENKASVNDEIFAHAKGAIAFDDEAGFWLMHSAPKTPTSQHANWLDPTPYAQHFFCVTQSADSLGQPVARHLRMNNVYVDSSTPTAVLSHHIARYPDIAGLLSQTHNHERAPITPPFVGDYLKQQLETLGGLPLVAVAKRGCNHALGKNWSCSSYEGIPNLFTDIMTRVLDGTLYAQTWCGGPWPSRSQQCLPSSCPAAGHRVYNVRTLRLSPELFWGTEVDHSKWLVSTAATSTPWVCLGDINYADPQRKRGGGFVCFKDTSLHDVVESMVKMADPCES